MAAVLHDSVCACACACACACDLRERTSTRSRGVETPEDRESEIGVMSTAWKQRSVQAKDHVE